MNNHLIFFYGTECPHCMRMEALVSKLDAEGFAISRMEIWHNEENMKKMEELDHEPVCGGVPFLINTKTNKSICGEVTYEELKLWAQDK